MENDEECEGGWDHYNRGRNDFLCIHAFCLVNQQFKILFHNERTGCAFSSSFQLLASQGKISHYLFDCHSLKFREKFHAILKKLPCRCTVKTVTHNPVIKNLDVKEVRI